MLFNSYQFMLGFFPVVFAGFFLVARWSRAGASYWLALASLFFYGWWSVKVLPLLLVSILANFYLGRRLSTFQGEEEVSTKTKKIWLISAVTANLSLLAFFKYANFLIDNLNSVSTSLGGQTLQTLNVVLPIGISFYTFTQIAYLVDCWQGKVKEPSFGHYALFVSYFPHLIAGPVLHHAEMMPQFRRGETYRLNYDAIALGLSIFSIGLAKKLLIADALSGPADALFSDAAGGKLPQFWAAWLGVLAYTFQIYFDFSGYSDMAIGLSLFFGIKLPINFNSPYKAASVIEFWRCWHMTLSRFLRDYLYIPLGGNQHGRLRRYANLLVTMVLGGLWHGANWTFVLWGCAHGVLLILNHAWRHLMGEVRVLWAKPIGRLLTFVAVCLAWVLFRANSLKTAMSVYSGMLGANGMGNLTIDPRLLFMLILSFVIALAYRSSQQIFNYSSISDDCDSTTQPQYWRKSSVFLIGTLLLVCMLRIEVPSPFLYFQF